MATPVRLPIRSFLRSATTSNPATKIHRTPCCSRIITQTQSRYSSTEDSSIWDITHKRAAPASADGKNAEAVEDEKYAYPDLPENVRFPRAVEATYLRPLRREAEYGIPSCDLQLRSYSVRNLEFFADFAMRAAYYLNLPAYGPIPLPRIVERWTVPLGHFIHKKSQENFERKTLRRMIQIKDGNEETVGIWLAFLEKHAYYGVGMKANVWSFDKLGVGKHMDAQMQDMRKGLQDTLDSIAFKKNSETAEKIVEVLNRENFRMASGQRGLMQEGRTQKQDEARPWKHPNIPSDAAQRAVRRGV